MRLSRITLIAAAVLLPAVARAAQQDETLARLDKALEASASFKMGGDSGPLRDAEEIVFRLSPESPLRAPVEEKLIDALSKAQTVDATNFLCRQLRVIGTARCVPALEKLLVDPQTSHMARYALGRLEVDEAAAAMLRAIGKTTGPVQVGLINTLADRRYKPAQADCVRLLGSSDADVAGAAAVALGRFGTTEAADALKAARAEVSGELALQLDNALLGCAEGLLATGNRGAAGDIYETFYKSGESQPLQFAGLRGLVQTLGNEAASLVATAMTSDDAAKRRFGISLAETVQGEKATRAFVAVLGALPAEDKALLLGALGARGDAAAAGAVVPLLKDEDAAVRAAALDALGGLGDASAVGALLEAAASAEGGEKNAARASLARVGGKEVDQRLVQLAGEGPVAIRVEAIDALASRGATASVGAVFAVAQDNDPAIRAAAARAIGALADKADLEALVKLAATAKTDADRAAVVEAAGKVFARIEDKAACAAPVLAALKGAAAESRPALLGMLGKAGAAESLGEVRAALASDDAAVRKAAVGALADWPDQAASGDLLKLISAAKSPEEKERGLRGYLRLAALSQDPGAMYLAAMKDVDSAAGKKDVLEELGLSAESPEALDVAVGLLDDTQLKANAGVAAMRIAHRLRGKDEGRARAALKTVLAKVQHEDVRRRAQEVLNELDKYEDHILAWVGVGPFTEKGKGGEAIYAKVFEPETNPDAADWKPITKGIGRWEINLEATYGGLDFCAAYLRTRVWSPVDQDARLELGSDDAIKAWLGGKLVHDHWKQSGADPRQEIVPVKLVKGWNDLMMKVVDNDGGWVGACRIRRPDGTALEGLKIEPR